MPKDATMRAGGVPAARHAGFSVQADCGAAQVGGGSSRDPASLAKGPGLILEDLSAFISVALHGSFARAAADQCIAQSALSKRVQRLEQRVGTPLLERRARGVVLTEPGQAFLLRAQRVVEEVADMERNLSSIMQTPSGKVRVAMPQRTCGVLAPPVIDRCRKELPLVDLQILEGTPGNVHEWMMSGEADIALAYNPELGTSFWVRPVLVEPLVLFGPGRPHPVHEEVPLPTTCSIQDLARLPLILPRKPSSIRVLIDRLCSGHGVRPNVIYETDGTQTVRGMVERGMGCTIFTLTAWHQQVAVGLLKAVPFATPLMNWKLCIVRARTDTNLVAVNRVQSFVEQESEALLDAGGWPYARRFVAMADSVRSPDGDSGAGQAAKAPAASDAVP